MSSFIDRFRLDGKVAVVSGAAGILGRQICQGLAEAGASVAMLDINHSSAAVEARRIVSSTKSVCLPFPCDITNEIAIRQSVAQIEQELGPIDVLHNNAATKGSNLTDFLAPLENYSMETWREVMAVNLEGMFLLARTVGIRMAERGHGTIIQTASIYGASMGPDQRIYKGSEYNGQPINTPPVYSASKGGVHALTLFLATYWGSRGVRVNTLTPGGVESGQNTQFIQNYSRRVPLGRMARVEEIVGAALFLASDASSYITGQNIHVDGGLSAW